MYKGVLYIFQPRELHCSDLITIYKRQVLWKLILYKNQADLMSMTGNWSLNNNKTKYPQTWTMKQKQSSPAD